MAASARELGWSPPRSSPETAHPIGKVEMKGDAPKAPSVECEVEVEVEVDAAALARERLGWSPGRDAVSSPGGVAVRLLQCWCNQ